MKEVTTSRPIEGASYAALEQAAGHLKLPQQTERSATDTAAERAVGAEQIAILFRQTPLMVAINIVNALLTGCVLVGTAPDLQLLLWLGLVLLLSGARIAVWAAHRRCAPETAESRQWAMTAAIGSALSGAIWGIGAALLFPEPILHRLFLVLVVAGMCAGAVAMLSAHLPSLIGFLVLATLPLAARLSVETPGMYVAVASMTLLFGVALSVAGINLNRAMTATLRLRVDLLERTRALDVTNALLRQEIADHRSTEATLHQAQKMEAIGQLTGGIAHDFNNLLTAVLGNLELAIPRTRDNPTVSGLLAAALHGAERGATLTGRLLAFARKQRLNPAAVDIVRLVRELDDLLTRTLGATVRIEITAPPDLPAAQVDARQLELAILNLALNGRDAMPGGGTIRIDLSLRRADPGLGASLGLRAGDYIVVSVADDGEGMDAETLDRAFEPFFTTKEIGKGSGLGLSMVHGFAAQSGGAIHLRSRIGEGTIAEIWLPRASARVADAPPTVAPRTEPTAPAPMESVRVVVCDDDEDVRQFLGEALRSGGIAVEIVDNAEAALKLIENGFAPDILIADYAMPGMRGDALVTEAQRRRPGLKALLISGYAEAIAQDSVAGVKLLRKPFKAAELLDLLRSA